MRTSQPEDRALVGTNPSAALVANTEVRAAIRRLYLPKGRLPRAGHDALNPRGFGGQSPPIIQQVLCLLMQACQWGEVHRSPTRNPVDPNSVDIFAAPNLAARSAGVKRKPMDVISGCQHAIEFVGQGETVPTKVEGRLHPRRLAQPNEISNDNRFFEGSK